MLDKETRKLIENLEKQRTKELEKRKKVYDKEIEQAAGERLKKKKATIWGKEKVEDITDTRHWTLVNVEALKEFIKYGSNKVLDQIRTRTHAQTLAREEIERMKKKQGGFDGRSAAITIFINAIMGVIVYVTVSNFFNYNQVMQEMTAEKRAHGD